MRIIIFAISLLLPVVSQAADVGLTTNSKEPVEITADETLEWRRNDTQFIARGAALAKQGDASVAAETLTADYRKGATSSMEIYKLSADRNVVLKSGANTAYGDQGEYDLDKSLAILTGNDLKMVAPDQTITANERFEYWTEEGKINAVGRAKVTRPKVGSVGVDTLEADILTAMLKTDATGKRVLDTLEAKGKVVITTPSEVVTGAYGIYRAGSNKAQLSGGVTIKRGPNVLEGERAEVDLTTNISKIFGATPSGSITGPNTGEGAGGRVRGVFYPGSQ